MKMYTCSMVSVVSTLLPHREEVLVQARALLFVVCSSHHASTGFFRELQFLIEMHAKLMLPMWSQDTHAQEVVAVKEFHFLVSQSLL